MEKDTSHSDHPSLYIEADRKIDKIKDSVSDLLQKDLNLTSKIDHLTNRIDFGVAKTGQKTLDKVTEMAVKLNDFEHQMAGHKVTIEHHEKILGRLMNGIFWICFVGVVGGFVGFAWHLIRLKLAGG